MGGGGETAVPAGVLSEGEGLLSSFQHAASATWLYSESAMERREYCGSVIAIEATSNSVWHVVTTTAQNLADTVPPE